MTLPHQPADPLPPAVSWLLAGDPSIRWQAMRDLTDAPDGAVATERARVAHEGWGAQLLAEQRPDGNWGDGESTPHWRSNLHTVLLLKSLGPDPASPPVRRAVALLRDHVTWGPEFGDSPFFEGEVEPCINGGVVALGAYFGAASERLVDRLLSEQLTDGGWNCEAERGSVRSSFHTTICVLEGLSEYERAVGASTAVTTARRRGEEYLLERQLLRRLSSGEVIDPRWTEFTTPSMWQYDVLRGMDYMRNAGIRDDPRLAEAVALIQGKQRPDGTWSLDALPRDSFRTEFEGDVGQPSRFNTLRALRVLRWNMTTPTSS